MKTKIYTIITIIFLATKVLSVDLTANKDMSKTRPIEGDFKANLEQLIGGAETEEHWETIAQHLEAHERGEQPKLSTRLFSQAAQPISQSIYSSYQLFFGIGKGEGECRVDLFAQIIPAGYKFDTHQVITDDGYIINMFRLKQKFSDKPNIGGPVIYLQHGLGVSADAWVVHHEKEALGLMLVSAGFDVWLGNARGSKYSYYHQTLDHDSKEYWAFSWQQMALHDITTSLKYVQGVTQVQKLMYVGHSQGTSEAFVLLSDDQTHKWANNLISHFVALAPICLMTNFRQKTILALSKYKEFIYKAAMKAGLWQFGKDNCNISKSKQIRWDIQCKINKKSCYKKFTFMDEFPEMDDISRTGVFLNTKPQAMSLRTLVHYAQLISKPKDKPEFSKYDFGVTENIKQYGQPTPPVWDLKNITTKLTLIVGTGDYFSTPQDVENLRQRLVNAQSVDMQVIEKYGHTTMILGIENYKIMTDLVNKLKGEVDLK